MELTNEDIINNYVKEKEVALNFQKRRHSQWNEIYLLYRNFVETNRLTQRQAVNIPIMKETVKTLLSKIDDAPDINFESLDNGVEKEYIIQELWNDDYNRLNFEGLDIIDKKNVVLYGRSFKKLNFINKKFDVDILDVFDVLVDPKTLPLDLETARYIIHQNIFKSLNEILSNDKYDKEAKNELKTFLLSEQTLIASSENKDRLKERAERLKTLGSENETTLEDLISGADVIVSLDEYYPLLWNEKTKRNERYVFVIANEKIILYKKTLQETLGINFLPFVSWGDDVEVNDFWSDGTGDIICTPNKVLNVWLSQLLENRTYRNFGMYFYNSSVPNFNPQSFEPTPFGMYPVPGNPNELMQPIRIEPLTDTVNEMSFITQMIERSSGASAIEKGVNQQQQTTLGEIQILAGKSQERIMSIAKFYRRAWKEFAEKWYAILEANINDKDIVKLYKKSYKGKNFKKEVIKSDWYSEAGYRVKITSSSEQETATAQTVQKLMAIKNMYPENQALQAIIQKRILEVVDLTPDEIKEIGEEEKQKQELIKQQQMQMQQVQEPQIPQEQPQQIQEPIIQQEQTQPQNIEPQEQLTGLEELPPEQLLQMRQALQ